MILKNNQQEVRETSMKYVNDFEYDRQGTVWGALILFMVFLFGAIFLGSVSLYIWVLEQINDSNLILLYTLLSALIIGCISPGILVWITMCKSTRYAALYGLMIAAVVIIAVPIYLGVPFASSP